MFHSRSLLPGRRRRVLGGACAAAFLTGLAPAAWSQPETAGCPRALPEAGFLADREDSLRAQKHLPDACLKSLVRQCDVDAESGFLDGARAAACSLRYEALLQHGFQGDFRSFLRWWQNAPRVAAQ